MTTPLICLLIVVFIPIVLAGTGGYFRFRQLGSLDNNNPREQVRELTGAGARVYAAQQNAWEATAIFTAAVVAAHLLEAEPGMSATLAMAFVAFRVLHPIFYIADIAPLRSIVFGGAVVSAVWLFVLGA